MIFLSIGIVLTTQVKMTCGVTQNSMSTPGKFVIKMLLMQNWLIFLSFTLPLCSESEWGSTSVILILMLY